MKMASSLGRSVTGLQLSIDEKRTRRSGYLAPQRSNYMRNCMRFDATPIGFWAGYVTYKSSRYYSFWNFPFWSTMCGPNFSAHNGLISPISKFGPFLGLGLEFQKLRNPFSFLIFRQTLILILRCGHWEFATTMLTLKNQV